MSHGYRLKACRHDGVIFRSALRCYFQVGITVLFSGRHDGIQLGHVILIHVTNQKLKNYFPLCQECCRIRLNVFLDFGQQVFDFISGDVTLVRL